MKRILNFLRKKHEYVKHMSSPLKGKYIKSKYKLNIKVYRTSRYNLKKKTQGKKL